MFNCDNWAALALPLRRRKSNMATGNLHFNAPRLTFPRGQIQPGDMARIGRIVHCADGKAQFTLCHIPLVLAHSVDDAVSCSHCLRLLGGK